MKPTTALLLLLLASPAMASLPYGPACEDHDGIARGLAFVLGNINIDGCAEIESLGICRSPYSFLARLICPVSCGVVDKDALLASLAARVTANPPSCCAEAVQQVSCLDPTYGSALRKLCPCACNTELLDSILTAGEGGQATPTYTPEPTPTFTPESTPTFTPEPTPTSTPDEPTPTTVPEPTPTTTVDGEPCTFTSTFSGLTDATIASSVMTLNFHYTPSGTSWAVVACGQQIVPGSGAGGGWNQPNMGDSIYTEVCYTTSQNAIRDWINQFLYQSCGIQCPSLDLSAHANACSAGGIGKALKATKPSKETATNTCVQSGHPCHA